MYEEIFIGSFLLHQSNEANPIWSMLYSGIRSFCCSRQQNIYEEQGIGSRGTVVVEIPQANFFLKLS